MCTGLLDNAFAQILRDWYDYAATIPGPPEMNYPTRSVSDRLMPFTGAMAGAVRDTIVEYGPREPAPGRRGDRQRPLPRRQPPQRCLLHPPGVPRGPDHRLRQHPRPSPEAFDGGGRGNPLERDPQRVPSDVRDEYISPEAALRDYGVVVIGDPVRDPEGPKVDGDATRARRAAMA